MAVDGGKFAVGQQLLAGHPNIADLMPTNGIGELRYRMVNRFGFRMIKINGD